MMMTSDHTEKTITRLAIRTLVLLEEDEYNAIAAQKERESKTVRNFLQIKEVLQSAYEQGVIDTNRKIAL